jgi:hypothetical protein
MSASIDELLFQANNDDGDNNDDADDIDVDDELLLYEAARDGDFAKVKDLLSKGTGNGYRTEVSYNYES